MATGSSQSKNKKSPNARCLTIDFSDLQQLAESYAPRNRGWTDEETKVLRMFYGKVPARVLAKKLGRSLNSIYLKHLSLNFRI